MPFVVTLAVVALCTVLAMVRVRRLGKAAYLLAVVVNEIPQVAALYLVLATVLAWVEGELSGHAGPVLLVLVGATLLAHLVLARRGMAAGATVRSALAVAGIRLADETNKRRLRPLLSPSPSAHGGSPGSAASPTASTVANVSTSMPSATGRQRDRCSSTCTAEATSPGGGTGRHAPCCTTSRLVAGCASAPATGSGPAPDFPSTWPTHAPSWPGRMPTQPSTAATPAPWSWPAAPQGRT